jgi:hypothetical protein
MARSPGKYGIATVAAKGDLAHELDFRLSPEVSRTTAAVARDIPNLRRRLDRSLGWSGLSPKPAAALAQGLWFGSGHGLILRSVGKARDADRLRQTDA